MCLFSLKKEKPASQGIAYKIAMPVGHDLCSIYTRYVWTLDEWYEDTNTITLKAFTDEQYQSGFHMYKSLRHAQEVLTDNKYVRVFEVEYDDATVEGNEVGGLGFVDVIVARKIRFVKEVTNP